MHAHLHATHKSLLPPHLLHVAPNIHANDISSPKQSATNYMFYVEFFKLYPELAGNDFYFSGESYAGVLVPTVALQILNHTTPANKVLPPSLPPSARDVVFPNPCTFLQHGSQGGTLFFTLCLRRPF